MNETLRACTVGALGACLAACDSRPSLAPASSDGVDVESWRVEEVHRIGTLEGDGAYVLGRIGAIEVARNGDILVFDLLANELRVFSSDGVHQRTVGRAGSGPGEFRSVIGMALDVDGDVWVVDGRNARYTVIGSDGSAESFRRTARVVRRPWVGGFDAEGRFHDLATEPVDGNAADMMLRMDTAGEVTDTFRIPRLEVHTVQLGGGGVTAAAPFAPRVLRAWDPRGGVWQAISSEYRITNVRLDGDRGDVVSRAHEPIPLTSEQSDSVASFVQRIESTYGMQVEPEMQPTVVAPLRWFVQDDEERLWVCATALAPCTELDVLDESGEFIATASLPVPIADHPPPVIRDGRLYAAVEDDMGAPQLLIGRIVPFARDSPLVVR